MGNWWLVTWNTYGTWLPGDPRGFRTWRGHTYVPPPRRYAAPGEPTYDRRKFADVHARALNKTSDAVRLVPPHRQVAMAAIVQDIAQLPLRPAILAVGGEHVHFLAKFGSLKIRQTVGRLKSEATRAIKQADPAFLPKRTWAKECHMRRLDDERAYCNAYAYIQRHINEGAAIHTWLPKPTSLPSG